MRIAVLFARLGPYHVARLKALSRFHSVIAVELSSANINYAWNSVDVESLTHVQLPHSNHREVSKRHLRNTLHHSLDMHEPDVVAVPGWWDPGALAAIKWCVDREVGVVMMSDSSVMDAPRQWWKEWPKRYIVGLCQSALVAGVRHVDYITHLGMPRDKVFVGYDVVDNDYFSAGARRVRSNDASRRRDYNLPESYFLACCRFVEKKNLFRLLEAYAKYRDRADPDSCWELVLLGDGPLRPEIEQDLRTRRLQDSVRMPGFCQYDALPVYYGLAKAFIHASTREQWGLVVNEAMASGLPVLVSDRCGCAIDLVKEDENGHRFDPYDVESLASHMVSVSTKPPDVLSAMGCKSREIINRWTPSTFAKNMSRASTIASYQSRTGHDFLGKKILDIANYVV